MRDKLKVFSGSAHPDFARSICDYLDLPMGRVSVSKFQNDNTFVQIEQNVRQSDVFVVQTSCEPVNDGFMELLIIMDALKRASARSITVVMPYFPYSRSDKKDQPRIAITAKLIADLLQTAGASRIMTMDLHAEQIQGFFDIPVDQLLAAPVLCGYLLEQDLGECVAVAPDVGSAKRTREYARRMGIPLAILDKRRGGNDDRSEILHVIGDVEGKTAIIFDDEVSSGGTLVNAVRALRNSDAGRVLAAVTHPILCGPATARLSGADDLEMLLVTDTLPVGPEKLIPKIRVVSVARLFGEAIRRIHDGTSISALFEA